VKACFVDAAGFDGAGQNRPLIVGVSTTDRLFELGDQLPTAAAERVNDFDTAGFGI
jgi:hypothetical protein